MYVQITSHIVAKMTMSSLDNHLLNDRNDKALESIQCLPLHNDLNIVLRVSQGLMPWLQ